MLLAIDTSGLPTVALVADDGTALAEARGDDPRGHAEAIGPLLTRVLDGVDRASISAVAYGTGPGPYTGLRVGMAAARSAAFALGAEELPVLSHDAVALAAVEAGTPLPLVVLSDAKRHERFSTPYRDRDGAGLPRRAAEPRVGPEEPPADLARAEGRVRAALLGRIAVLRRAADLPPEPPAARYLRSPDVTLSTPKRVSA